MTYRKSKININVKLEALKLNNENMHIDDISRTVGYGPVTVKYWIKKGKEALLNNSGNKKYHKVSAVLKKQAIEMIKDGMNFEEVGKIFDVHPATVKFWMTKEQTIKSTDIKKELSHTSEEMETNASDNSSNAILTRNKIKRELEECNDTDSSAESFHVSEETRTNDSDNSSNVMLTSNKIKRELEECNDTDSSAELFHAREEMETNDSDNSSNAMLTRNKIKTELKECNVPDTDRKDPRITDPFTVSEISKGNSLNVMHVVNNVIHSTKPGNASSEIYKKSATEALNSLIKTIESNANAEIAMIKNAITLINQ